MSEPGATVSRRRVLTHAALRSAQRLGLSREEFSRVIGCPVSRVARMNNRARFLNEHRKEWELATLLVRLYDGLATILATDSDAVKAWMREPNSDLRAIPAQSIGTIAGLVTAVRYVDTHRART